VDRVSMLIVGVSENLIISDMNPHTHPTTPKPTCTHTLLLHMCTVLELTNSRAGHKREAWENSFLPTSMTTLFRVRPWDLLIVTAHASLRGREGGARVAVKVDRITAMGKCGGPPVL